MTQQSNALRLGETRHQWFFVRVVLVFFGTILFLSLAGEGLARLLFPEQEVNSCAVGDVASLRFKPNCVSAPMKLWEGPWFRYATNDCGFRSSAPCTSGSPNGSRIELIGTSIANGMDVPADDMFAARAERLIQTQCSANVKLENLAQPLASIGKTPLWHHVSQRFSTALRMKPAAIVLTVTALDVAQYTASPEMMDALAERQKAHPKHRPLAEDLKAALATTRFITAVRSVTFRDKKAYLTRFLQKGDEAAYLYKGMSPTWKLRLQIASSLISQMADKAREQNIPFLIIYVPTYQQAIAASLPQFVPRFDPLGYNGQIAAIAQAHGAYFADFTPAIAQVSDLPSLYYMSTDHPNATGNRILASNLVKVLTKDLPAFANCRVGA